MNFLRGSGGDKKDMLWIRSRFLDSDADHGYVVVHGHTQTIRPEVRNNRIGIDTGEARPKALTAVALDGTSPPRFPRRFRRSIATGCKGPEADSGPRVTPVTPHSAAASLHQRLYWWTQMKPKYLLALTGTALFYFGVSVLASPAFA